MPTLILDPAAERQFNDLRTTAGLSQRDEVWEGVTVVMPLPTLEHQDIVAFFVRVFGKLFDLNDPVTVQAGANVSDRVEGWETNYREPDFVFVRAGGRARACGTHWCGGPDFLAEVVSPQDQSRDKLPFYESIGTREVLIVDRDPWQLELYQLRRGRLRLAGKARPGDTALASHVVPLSFALVRGRPRPKVRISHAETGQDWTF
ncbi:MAG TPA: Uma2 family endonuclease [Gemmataceae bacterium]|nr:Uma2 family endonuclease [Gemmataceae bacterium]